MGKKPKPCPICGSPAVSRIVIPLDRRVELVMCGECYRKARHEIDIDEGVVDYTPAGKWEDLPSIMAQMKMEANEEVREKLREYRSEVVMDLLEDVFGYRPRIEGEE